MDWTEGSGETHEREQRGSDEDGNFLSLSGVVAMIGLWLLAVFFSVLGRGLFSAFVHPG